MRVFIKSIAFASHSVKKIGGAGPLALLEKQSLKKAAQIQILSKSWKGEGGSGGVGTGGLVIFLTMSRSELIFNMMTYVSGLRHSKALPLQLPASSPITTCVSNS